MSSVAVAGVNRIKQIEKIAISATSLLEAARTTTRNWLSS